MESVSSRRCLAGGSVEMPYDKALWGAWFAMFNDKYGIKWMVNFEEK